MLPFDTGLLPTETNANRKQIRHRVRSQELVRWNVIQPDRAKQGIDQRRALDRPTQFQPLKASNPANTAAESRPSVTKAIYGQCKAPFKRGRAVDD